MLRPRFYLTILVIGAVIFNGVWHVAYADFHSHSDDFQAATVAPSGASSVLQGGVDHAGDQLVHPLHQQAYLYQIQVLPPSVHSERLPELASLLSLSAPISGLFRPPAP